MVLEGFFDCALGNFSPVAWSFRCEVKVDQDIDMSVGHTQFVFVLSDP